MVEVTVGPLDQPGLERFAGRLAEALEGGDCVLLDGPLGAGKTTFARALIRTRVGAPVEVPSPTFTLIQDYGAGDLTIRHADLYRIAEPDELLEIGLGEVEPDVVLLVEWPERGGDRLPPDQLRVRIEPIAGDEERRQLTLCAGPAWARRLPALADG